MSLTYFKKDKYRFGFNGKEKNNEWAGVGNSIDYGFRMEDTRIARFRSNDALYWSEMLETNFSVLKKLPDHTIIDLIKNLVETTDLTEAIIRFLAGNKSKVLPLILTER